MGKRPVIGIPLMGKSPFRKYMQSKYIQSLERAGAKVVRLNPDTSPWVIQRYLRECDGFLFPGGADVEPALYGAEREAACGAPNVIRDNFEYPLLQAVLRAHKPVLCICRGVQLLNVVCGGTMLQDITPKQTYPHSDGAHRKTGTHSITLAENGALTRIWDSREIFVNSMHHQVVDRVGAGLRIAATSPEGYVEALELKDYGAFGIGVQWHPEHMSPCSRQQQKLFDVFVKSI